MEMNGEPHALAVLPLVKEAPVLISTFGWAPEPGWKTEKESCPYR
jgi:hypothetical protein